MGKLRPFPGGGARRLRGDRAGGVLASLLAVGASLSQEIPPEEWRDDFARSPLENGWAVFGDADLFAWDEAREALRVTWDSARPNSYFFRPLGTELSRTDDFGFGFALELEAVTIGVNPGKPHTFELGVGLHRHAEATDAGFRRGSGMQSPNLVELAYFPDSGYGATVWPTLVAANGRFNWSGAGDFLILELAPGARYAFWIEYSAADSRLALQLTRDGISVGAIPPVVLSPQFTDFRVDTFAVRSYSDDGADGSLLARGWVDDIHLQLPPPPIERITGRWEQAAWKVSFAGRPGWRYRLQRRVPPEAWQNIGAAIEGEPKSLELVDPAPLPATALYRVEATKP